MDFKSDLKLQFVRIKIQKSQNNCNSFGDLTLVEICSIIFLYVILMKQYLL